MAEELKPPVAIRITRPYTTETEFLEREFDTLTHTSVVLLGAQARPQGVVLRFEIVLKTGESILRGEGRVVGYKERAHAGEAGLSLRFTRLDSRSKTLVDRASALREARVRASTSLMSMPAVVVPRPPAEAAPAQTPSRPPLEGAPASSRGASSRPSAPPSLRPSAPPPSSRNLPPPLPEWARLGGSPPSSPVSVDIESTQVDAHFDRAPPSASPPVAEPAVARPSSLPPSSAGPVSRGIRPTPARPPPLPRTLPRVASTPPPPVAAAAAASGGARGSIARPADREALLVRLRRRGESLPRSRVDEILAKRAR